MKKITQNTYFVTIEKTNFLRVSIFFWNGAPGNVGVHGAESTLQEINIGLLIVRTGSHSKSFCLQNKRSTYCT